MGIYDTMRKAYRNLYCFLNVTSEVFPHTSKGVCFQGYKVQHPAVAKSISGINLNSD